MGSALVLNASFEPLRVVSWQRAMQLLFQGKVEVVEESDKEVRTVSLTFRIPSVLRLVAYVDIPRKMNTVRFSRTNVFLRDKYLCQYCRQRFSKEKLTLDHVVPIVQGGKKTWDNIVTACKRCNQKKGGRTPEQASLKLLKKPKRPHGFPAIRLSLEAQRLPASWADYLNTATIAPAPVDELTPQKKSSKKT